MNNSDNLTNSLIRRQNIINNRYAVREIHKSVGDLQGIPFDDDYYILKRTVASFFDVSERIIEDLISRHDDELIRNGYRLIKGNELKKFRLAYQKTSDNELPKTIPSLSIFSFRAFLNIGMLLTDSLRAKQLRNLILDITIDTINVRTGGQTKYVNRRDEDFIKSLFKEEDYRQSFTDALRDCVGMGNYKYPLFTNRIYESIFKEKSKEYREILKLDKRDKVRDTFYSEILDLISAYEYGFAQKIRDAYNHNGKKRLSFEETDKIFKEFVAQPHWTPLVERAREKMASRDLAFRDATHPRLERWIRAVDPDDFEKFLGKQSKDFDKQLEEAKESMRRLRNRK